MTVLSDLTAGDAVVVLGSVAALDDVTGCTLNMLGPDGSVQGQLTISPAGAFGGQLAFPATQVPVQLVPELNAVSPGDVLSNARTGETMVARLVKTGTDGSYQWSSSQSGQVWYPMDGWNRAGTATLS